MSEVRYTLVEGEGRGREYPMANNQYFYRRGGKFVYMEAGAANLCGSANRPFGWCEAAKDDTGKDGWKSVTGDNEFIIAAEDDNVFEIPALETKASLAASQIGLGFKCVTRGATYAQIQYALVGNTTASPLEVVDVDTDNHTVKVKVGPYYRQR